MSVTGNEDSVDSVYRVELFSDRSQSAALKVMILQRHLWANRIPWLTYAPEVGRPTSTCLIYSGDLIDSRFWQDDRAMQIDAGLKVIEKKLSKAHDQIDRFDARYSNLFLAYFDLRKETDRGTK